MLWYVETDTCWCGTLERYIVDTEKEVDAEEWAQNEAYENLYSMIDVEGELEDRGLDPDSEEAHLEIDGFFSWWVEEYDEKSHGPLEDLDIIKI